MKRSIFIAVALSLPAMAQQGQPMCPSHIPGPFKEMMPNICGIMKIGHDLVMEKYDTDKDGKLSDDERKAMQEAVRKNVAEKKAAFLQQYDVDKDGKLSDDEREAVKKAWLDKNPELAKKMEEMKAQRKAQKEERVAKRAEFMKKFDKDGDGKLSDDERKVAREERKNAMIDKMFEQADADKDGKLSKEELKSAMAEFHKQAPGVHGKKMGYGRKHGQGMMPHRHRFGHGPQMPPNSCKGFNPHRPHADHNADTPQRKGKHGKWGMMKKPHMMAGGLAIFEKYDVDKDNILSESEIKQLKDDAQKAAEAVKQAAPATPAEK